MNTAEIMDIFDAAKLLRPVSTRPISVEGIGILPDRKAIVFDDTDDYISIVGANYHVVQNEELYSNLAGALIKSKVDLEGLNVRASTSGNQARSLVELRLPAYQVEVGTGDFTVLSSVMRNSYDGSWKNQLDLGGFRIACANGQIVGDYQSVFAKRHTGNFDMPNMVEHLVQSVQNFAEMGKRWMTMTGQPITNAQGIDLMLSFIGRKAKDEAQLQEWLENKRARNVQGIVAKWEDYSNKLGSNMWALYNAMTDHSTHVGDITSPADAKNWRAKQVVRVMQEADEMLAA